MALDQDPESLVYISQRFDSRRVRTLEATVKQFIRGCPDLEEFDLIYSASLYDYLADPVALALSERLKAALSPEGRFVIGKFEKRGYGRGYLDWLMNWHLIYRDADELLLVIGSVGGHMVRAFEHPHQNVHYVELQLQ